MGVWERYIRKEISVGIWNMKGKCGLKEIDSDEMRMANTKKSSSSFTVGNIGEAWLELGGVV